MRKLATALVAAALVAAAGCSGGSGPDPADAGASRPADVPLGPAGPDFYQPPAPPPDAEPGDLIWVRPLESPAGSEGFTLLYWSTAASGELVPVSGVMFRPVDTAGSAPAIVAWAEGTSGMGDECAPSRAYLRGAGPSGELAQLTLDLGGAFVASDYEGLGTPGEHPYIAQGSAGRNVLDSIRAAATLVGVDAPPEAVVLGTSQGGGAALFAAELQPSYAPDLRLLGAVAVAPPSRLSELNSQLDGGPYFGYVLMAIAGLRAAYPELAEEVSALSPAGRAAVDQVLTMCTGEILQEFANDTAATYGTDAVLSTPVFSQVLDENDPGQLTTDVPILIVHGERDDTIPVANSRELVSEYCGNGGSVSAEFYPDHGHVDVLPAALAEIVMFLQARLAGEPVSPACSSD